MLVVICKINKITCVTSKLKRGSLFLIIWQTKFETKNYFLPLGSTAVKVQEWVYFMAFGFNIWWRYLMKFHVWFLYENQQGTFIIFQMCTVTIGRSNKCVEMQYKVKLQNIYPASGSLHMNKLNIKQIIYKKKFKNRKGIKLNPPSHR